MVSIRALVNVHATTHPAASLAPPPPRSTGSEPAPGHLLDVLDAEAESDPE